MIRMLMVLALMAAPAMADSIANPEIPNTGGTPEWQELPMPSSPGPADMYVAPSKDVPLYVPLTEEQQELPINEPDPGYDYVPGMETPSGGKWPKQIVDQVPAQ